MIGRECQDFSIFSGFIGLEWSIWRSGPRNLKKIDPLILKSFLEISLEESVEGRKVSRLPTGEFPSLSIEFSNKILNLKRPWG